MTPTEAVALTGYIQAHFPSTPINEFTPDALHDSLAEYPLADCKAAVRDHVNFAKEGARAFCAPADVVAGVKRIRAKRIAAAPPMIPPAGLSEPEEREWQGRERRRIASGLEPSGRPQVEGSKRDMRQLGTAGREVDPKHSLAEVRAAHKVAVAALREAEAEAAAEKQADRDRREQARKDEQEAREALRQVTETEGDTAA